MEYLPALKGVHFFTLVKKIAGIIKYFLQVLF